MGILSKLFGQKPRWEAPARDLYDAVVLQARQESFYLQGKVPDTIDGRFDLVVLHAFLLFRRLKTAGAEAAALSQKTFDMMFADFDESLREMGVTDLGISPKIKKMAKAFFGRVHAYDGSIEDEQALSAALGRNLYRGNDPGSDVLAAMVAYTQCQAAFLTDQADAELMKGRVRFVAPQLP